MSNELPETHAKYRGALAALDSAVGDLSREEGVSEDLREICRCLLRALGTGKTLQNMAFGDEPIDVAALRTQRKLIHTVMGAPGDWGYDTPIGEALSRLYALSI